MLVAVILTAGAMQAQNQTNSDQPDKKTLVLSATDMGCKTDCKLVETALYRKKGVKSVKIEGETITIVYNPKKVKPEELQAAVENTGTCEDPNAKVHKVKILSN